jgi:cytoskeletal protein CcmA (bactofilin family)
VRCLPSNHQEQPHDTSQALACGLAPNSKLELNNPKVRPRSLIDKLANFTGDLWSDGDIQIDGHLFGNVNCAQLIIGKDAAVIGAIIAQEAVIRGRVTGLIRATRVLVQASAHVESEIIYQSLSVDEGASFEGIARPRADPFAEELPLGPWPTCNRHRPRACRRLRTAVRASRRPATSREPRSHFGQSSTRSLQAPRPPALTDVSGEERSLPMPQVSKRRLQFGRR